jgi:hypothetical protein
MKIKPNDLKNLPPHIRRLNPHLFGLGAVESSEPKPDQGRALVNRPQADQASQRRVADGSAQVLRVSLVSCRSKLCDRDNLIAGMKPLRDAVARFFGLDDAETTIEWEYAQIEAREQGTIVKVEMI